MSIRVTSGMMNSQLLSNLNRNNYSMNKMENQISTGRKLNKPSDDPVGVTYALRYRSDLASNEQYKTSTDAAIGWLDTTDTNMSQASEVMHRIKDLTVQGANGTLPQSGMDAVDQEIKELKQLLVGIGNTQIRGKYIFNGQQYDKAPYQLTDTVLNFSDINPDTAAVEYSIGDEVTFRMNTSGSEFFGTSTDADNVFKVLDDLSAALASGNTAAISAQLVNIESRSTKMLASQTEVGARTNRIELVQNRLTDGNLNLTTLQSKVEDADIASLLIQATSAQTIYQAALKSSAQIMSTSLMDYMR
ncbi:flagellar hook-associated protein FlgL [Paenibacillus macquariensis]|uniref:Flagellar hook-associated protein 3 FlgL n=1 Tax=Paenibacillus macquariensis TaxID=948756 RepID=A0ABY1K6R1_9BACL|nr:flagellar hook-associated protein FlgL [Paenibacillus macquariensis]MEC0093654.1 flagellar hook-associated protein FlgL [Paenibacillus macquariensis]OAB35533.1 flagellar biosynthesis protein FlgL [Paenibacillus macquariensis subsp. macquariensis]SIR34125.1 flagellar hook-associated protein 3 FlgL [Paenibacillus macquariensis]